MWNTEATTEKLGWGGVPVNATAGKAKNMRQEWNLVQHNSAASAGSNLQGLLQGSYLDIFKYSKFL